MLAETISAITEVVPKNHHLTHTDFLPKMYNFCNNWPS